MSDSDSPIKQRISYKQPPMSLYNVSNVLGSSAITRPVSRIDYWEDGSATTTFYLEISADQYDLLSRDGRLRIAPAASVLSDEDVERLARRVVESIAKQGLGL